MAISRTKLEQLESRIEAIAARLAPKPHNEAWLIEGDRAWPVRGSKDDAIPVAEMRDRPCPGHRIEVIVTHADPNGSGWLAECCLPGGACYALHGESGGNRPPGWTGG
jgi:hypothetical protein